MHKEIKEFDLIEAGTRDRGSLAYFDDWNNKPLDDPRTRLIANDARNHFMLTPDGHYDVIVSEPSNPWLSGVSNLFTREFFDLGKREAAPGGVDPVGPDVRHGHRGPPDPPADLHGDLPLRRPVQHHRGCRPRARRLRRTGGPDRKPHRSRHGAESGRRLRPAADRLRDPEDVLTRYQIDQDDILDFASDAVLNTDDNMRIEYSAACTFMKTPRTRTSSRSSKSPTRGVPSHSTPSKEWRDASTSPRPTPAARTS